MALRLMRPRFHRSWALCETEKITLFDELMWGVFGVCRFMSREPFTSRRFC